MDKAMEETLLKKVKDIKDMVEDGDFKYNNVKNCLKSNIPLFNWYVGKRHSLLIGSLTDEEVLFYKAVGMDFDIALYVWSDWADILKKHMESNNITVVYSEDTFNEVYCIGKWAKRQKTNWKKLTEEQKDVLLKCGTMYLQDTKRYKVKKSTEDKESVKNIKKIKNSAEDKESVKNNKKIKNTTEENPPMKYTSKYGGIKSFEEGIELLKQFKHEFPEKKLTASYKTEAGIKLGRWYKDVKDEIIYKRIPYVQIRRLQLLGCKDVYCRGFSFKDEEETWINYYELAKNYKLKGGTSGISEEGYECERKISNRWINKQRNIGKTILGKEKVELLNHIIKAWTKEEEEWLKIEEKRKSDKKYFLDRQTDILADFSKGVVNTKITCLVENEKTGKLVNTRGICDYYECDILLSGLLEEENLILFVEKNKTYLIEYARQKVLFKYGKLHNISERNLKVDKARFGITSRYVSVMFSVHL